MKINLFKWTPERRIRQMAAIKRGKVHRVKKSWRELSGDLYVGGGV